MRKRPVNPYCTLQVMGSGLQKWRRNRSEGGMPSFRCPKSEKKTEIKRDRQREKKRGPSSPSELAFHLLQSCFGNRLLRLLGLLCRGFFQQGTLFPSWAVFRAPPPPSSHWRTSRRSLVGGALWDLTLFLFYFKPRSWCAIDL